MRITSTLCFRASLIARLTKPPLIDINKATFYRRQPSTEPSDEEQQNNRPLFPNLDFSIPSENVDQQYWAICGPSNAGKTTFLEVLRGQHLCFPPNARRFPYLSSDDTEVKDKRSRHPSRAIQYVGFDTKEKGLSGMGTYLSARYESRREVEDFSVADFLKGNTQLNALPVQEAIDSGLYDRVVEDMRLGLLLNMPLSNLSNGQTRRARIAKALLGKPELLLLDEPFMGLDPPTMLTLSPILHRLASQESPRLLLSLRPQDPIPDWITHLLYLGEDMKITLQGLKEDVGIALMAAAVVTENSNEKIDKLPRFNAEFGRTITEGGVVQVAHDRTTKDISWESAQIIRWNSEAIPPGEAVIEMEGVSVKYGDKPVLGNWKQEVGDPKRLEDGLWWKVRQGQRWGVFGPNGSGKTTLLSLILSDHPQSYSVPMKLFGRSRLPSPGQAGISIFELQRRIGHSSPEVHGFFPRQLSVRRTLESAYAEAPLGKPLLSVDADARIDACLRWFQAELNPSLGMHARMKRDQLERIRDRGSASKNRRQIAGNPEFYREIVNNELFEEEQEMAASLEWADDLTFGELPFTAQRVALFLRAIVAQPDIVVLDEAFSGMDDYIRDKCLLFLDYGESRRISFWKADRTERTQGKYVNITRPTYEKREHYIITEGLTKDQALVVVSHVKEEIPSSVRDWIFLPESETGEPCVIGSIDRCPLREDQNLWDQIWGVVPLVKQREIKPRIRKPKFENPRKALSSEKGS